MSQDVDGTARARLHCKNLSGHDTVEISTIVHILVECQTQLCSSWISHSVMLHTVPPRRSVIAMRMHGMQ